jgi:hypothetical protein
MKRGLLIAGLALAVVMLIVGGRWAAQEKVENAPPAAAPSRPVAESLPTLTLPARESPQESLAPAASSVPEAVPAAPPAVADVAGKPRLRGRVLQTDGRTPAAAARVRLELKPRRPSDWEAPEHVTDDAGAFAIDLDPDREVERAELVIVDSTESAYYAPPDLELDSRTGADLGDIVLEPLRSFAFRVIDERQQPVRGARGAAVESAEWRTSATRDDGTGVLEPVPRGCRAIRVWALGFAPAIVELPDPLPSEPTIVELAPCPLLTIHVVAPEGGSTDGLELHATSAEVPFASATVEEGADVATLDPTLMHIGMTMPNIVFRPNHAPAGAEVLSVFQPDSDGSIVLSDLRPDLELTLSLVAAGDVVVWGPQRLTLKAGERRELEARLPVAGQRVHVRVRDPDGQPVSSAFVMLVGQHGMDALQATDSGGEATFENVLVTRANVLVQAKGRARLLLMDVALPTAGTFDVTVRPGAAVAIAVVDAHGHPCKVDGFFLSVGGVSLPEIRDRPGDDEPASAFTLQDAPASNFQIHVVRNGDVVVQDVAAGATEVSVTVPWNDDGP